MTDQLEMLTQREQLMEDIDTICDEFFFANYDGDLSVAEDFVRMLNDAVCKNFPTKWSWLKTTLSTAMNSNKI